MWVICNFAETQISKLNTARLVSKSKSCQRWWKSGEHSCLPRNKSLGSNNLANSPVSELSGPLLCPAYLTCTRRGGSDVPQICKLELLTGSHQHVRVLADTLTAVSPSLLWTARNHLRVNLPTTFPEKDLVNPLESWGQTITQKLCICKSPPLRVAMLDRLCLLLKFSRKIINKSFMDTQIYLGKWRGFERKTMSNKITELVVVGRHRRPLRCWKCSPS